MTRQIIGMTMCSGIGAPEVAAPWVDWRLASEIEPFPRAVLQQRFGYRLPEDQNQGDPLLWGDMTEITPDLLRERGLPLPDLIVAGTPCQAFSVAGARKGLEDARGNLTLSFVEILHDFAAARPDGKLAALWENVPGVLSDKGNAFGCFLGGIVGAMDALPRPAGGSWPREGMVEGPRERAAWCVLDSQWFGVAQRRERVFVVVDFGNCVDPAAVLLEPDRLRGDSPPRREAGQSVAGTFKACATSGGWSNSADHAAAGYMIPVPDVSMCLNAGAMGRIDSESETFIPVAHSLRGEGFDASEDGTRRGTPIVPVSIAMRGREDGAQMEIGDDCAFTLRASTGGGDKPHVFAPVAFDTTQITSAGNYSNPKAGDPCHPLAAGAHPPAIAFDCKGTEVQFSADGSHPTLRSMGHDGSHQNGGGHAAVCYEALQPLGVYGTNNYASKEKRDTGEILRRVREALGEEAFAAWGLGISYTLQPQEVLRQEVHGERLRPQEQARCRLVGLSPGGEEDCPPRTMREVWCGECSGCAPQGSQLPEQLAIELGAYLSALPYCGASAQVFLQDMWEDSEGAWVLRHALSEVQEAWRSTDGGGEAETSLSGVRKAGTLEGALWNALYARQEGKPSSMTEQSSAASVKGGDGVWAVRRLTPR